MNKYAVWYDYNSDDDRYIIHAHRLANRVLAVFLPRELATGFDSAKEAAQHYAESQGLDEEFDDIVYDLQDEETESSDSVRPVPLL